MGLEINPIQYQPIDKCLYQLHNFIKCFKFINSLTRLPSQDITVHMPRIACGLAGQKWEKIEPLINKHLENVYVYDLPKK